MPRVPIIEYAEREGEASYWISLALDALVADAIEAGCPPDQFRERVEEAIERAEDND